MITAQLPHRTVREKTVIAHVSIGVRNNDRGKPFYDAALEPLGYGRESIALWVVSAERPVPADEKSGLHFCIVAPSRAAVDAFHAAALRAGGRDNGAPCLRTQYDPDYYAAFVVDPDGYRIEAYCGPAER